MMMMCVVDVFLFGPKPLQAHFRHQVAAKGDQGSEVVPCSLLLLSKTRRQIRKNGESFPDSKDYNTMFISSSLDGLVGFWYEEEER